jgi:hypothetical protein
LDIDIELPVIPEIKMDSLWDYIREHQPTTLADLPGQTTSPTRTYATSQTESKSSDEAPVSVVSSDSECEVEYDPGTHGLTPGAFICAPLLINAAKNGKYE